MFEELKRYTGGGKRNLLNSGVVTFLVIFSRFYNKKKS
jgi:hypothetical protein